MDICFSPVNCGHRSFSVPQQICGSVKVKGMKLSAILEPLVRGKASPEMILDIVRAFEDDKQALLASLVPAGKRIRSRQWGKIRQRIMERDSYVCSYCGGAATDIDHVTPIRWGGSNEDDNLVASCGPCNRSKGAKPLTEWREQH